MVMPKILELISNRPQKGKESEDVLEKPLPEAEEIKQILNSH